jgi:hypothetical protein
MQKGHCNSLLRSPFVLGYNPSCQTTSPFNRKEFPEMTTIDLTIHKNRLARAIQRTWFQNAL